MTIYTPYKEVWTTVVTDVEYIEPVSILDPAHYCCTIIPNDPNELGGDTGLKQVGDYLKDFVGSTYPVVAINIDGDYNRVEVSDDQFTGAGPQSGQYGYLYRSVVDGDAPYLAPVRHFFLDKTAMDYSRAMELEILWRECRHTKPIYNTYVGKDVLLNSSDTLSTLNVGVGYNALYYLTTGDYNAALGGYAGQNVSNDIEQYRVIEDSNLTLIGYNATKNSAGVLTNSVALGSNSIVTDSNQIVLGDTAVTQILTSGDYMTRGHKSYFGSIDNYAIGIKTNNVEVITVATNGDSNFTGIITTPSIRITNGATVGYYWRCINATTGAGEWAAITASQQYLGTIDGATGIPAGGSVALIDGTGTQGDYYIAYSAGTYDYGNPSGNSIILAIGDSVFYSSTGVWEKVPNAGFVLDIASATVLGGVKIGSGVSIDGSGVISVSTNYQAPLSGTGFVKISGTTISYDNSSYYLASNPNGYTSNLGTVTSIGTASYATGLTLTGGIITSSGTISLGLTPGYVIPTPSDLFPGFGTSHVRAAYGDHTHTGVYEPFLGYPASSGYVLSSTTGGVRSWVAAAGSYIHPTYTPLSAQNLSGANIFKSIVVDTIGSVTSVATRVLTLADLGYYGSQLADNYGYWALGSNNNSVLQTITSNGYACFNAGLGISIGQVGAVITITATGGGTGGGSVTSVSAGNGMNFTTITASGPVTMGTPSTLTASTLNALTANSHTHAVTGFEASLGNPSVTGYVLSSTTAGVRSWVAMSGGGGTPAGSTGEVQFNNGGVFGASSNFKWDGTSVNVINTASRYCYMSGTIIVSANGTTDISMSSTAGYGTIGVNNGQLSLNATSVSINANTNCGSYTVTAGNFILFSDSRLKSNIKGIDLSPVNIEYKEYEMISHPGEKRYGVIAQDLLWDYPELVAGNQDDGYSVKYIDLLVREVASLKEEVRILKSKL